MFLFSWAKTHYLITAVAESQHFCSAEFLSMRLLNDVLTAPKENISLILPITLSDVISRYLWVMESKVSLQACTVSAFARGSKVTHSFKEARKNSLT